MKKKEKTKTYWLQTRILILIAVFLLIPYSWAQAAQPQVAAGLWHTVGLKSDGTVVAVGDNEFGQLNNVGLWIDIVQVAASLQTVGLKPDGTVVAVGDSGYGQLPVSSWGDIVQVTNGVSRCVGLKSDGTVEAVAYGVDPEVFSWTNIVQIAAGIYHDVGVKSDGTAVAAGSDWSGETGVDLWTNIVQVAAGFRHTVGLKSDRTVVGVGYYANGQLDVDSWGDIVQVAAGSWHTVGLKSDGTVVCVGDNTYGQLDVGLWIDIVQVSAGAYNTVGLKSDGTVVCVGHNGYGQCDVSTWSLGMALIQVNIKPEGDSNRINLRSNGKIVVAILSTPDFDAPSQVDQSSLTFGATGDEQSLISCKRRPKDVNHDGVKNDLVCQFYIQLAGFKCGDTEGILKGLTMEGKLIEGKDLVNIVKCK